LKVQIGKNEMRIMQPFMFGKRSGDKIYSKIILADNMFCKLFLLIRSQEIDFQQENARYRDQMNFDHQNPYMVFAENVICEFMMY